MKLILTLSGMKVKIRPFTEDMVDDVILTYSITVHKAQGSQWDVIIVPVYKTINLDRSKLYTAITRARKKVILLGDLEETRTVVKISLMFQKEKQVYLVLLRSFIKVEILQISKIKYFNP